MRHILLTVAAIATAATLRGTPLTPEESLTRALPALSRVAAEREPVITTPGVYVFNLSEGGFALTATDSEMPLLLGYSDTGSVNPENMPDGLHWFIGACDNLHTRTGGNNDIGDDTKRRDIAPLVEAMWGQLSPYNLLCPQIDGKPCPSGCVATAMAEVMRRWKYPANGIGTISYEWLDTELTYDFTADTYDWENMPYHYNQWTSEERNLAVARLMVACGMATKMNYGPESSGSHYYNSAIGMIEHFNYDKGLTCRERDFYLTPEWTDMMYNELRAGRPVLYSGLNDEGGHAFVCDGYQRGGFFHINWGWSGGENGYYLLTALDPVNQGTGGTSAGYNAGQLAIIGIRPDAGTTEIIPIMRCYGVLEAAESEYVSTDEVVLLFTSGMPGNRSDDTNEDDNEGEDIGFFSGSAGDITVEPGVKLVPSDGGAPIYVGVGEELELSVNNGVDALSFAPGSFPSAGSYIVVPAYRCRGLWYDGLVMPGIPAWLTLSISDDNLTFANVDNPADITTPHADNRTIPTLYTPSGIPAGEDGRPLAPGIYISNTGKMIVK